MKNILYLLLPVLLLLACERRDAASSNIAAHLYSVQQLFSIFDAAAILGEPSHLEDSLTSRTTTATNYSLSFKANALDSLSGKTGAIYLFFEQYDDSAEAKARYTFIKIANMDHGIKTLDAVADEAYYHSDNQNFYFIMARRGATVFNIKVNKITSHTSKEAFDQIARRVAAAL